MQKNQKFKSYSYFWLDPSDCPFFCLDAKEPKSQGCVCWATPSLRFAVHAANSLRSDSDAPAAPLRSSA